MKNVKVSEIMSIIEDIIKLDGEESNALEIRIDQLLKSKERDTITDIGGGFQNSGVNRGDGLSGFRGFKEYRG